MAADMARSVTDVEKMLAGALSIARGGRPVFPCRANKRPWTQRGLLDATTDEKQIISWWKRWPDALIGMPTGARSGMIVIDVDKRNGGLERFDGLKNAHGGESAWPSAPAVQTKNGGLHYYFSHREGIKNSVDRIAPGVDVRAEGGYVIVPPSPGYEFYDCEDEPVPEMPDWVADLATARSVDGKNNQQKQPGKNDESLVFGEGHRNDRLTSIGGSLRRIGMQREEILGALREVNRLRCQPPLSESEVAAIARSMFRYRPDQVEEAIAFGTSESAAEGLRVRRHADRVRDRLDPPPMIIDGMIPAGGIAALIALPGIGKTLVATEIAQCIASGTPMHGRIVSQGRVLYICSDSPASTERRMLAIEEEVASKIDTVCECPGLPGGMEKIRNVIDSADASPYSLIIIDTWDSSREHRGADWSSQDALLESILRELRNLAEEQKLGIIIIHHATRADGGRARGSVVFDARADWIGLVAAEGDDHVTLVATKARDGERGRVGSWRIDQVDVGGRAVPILIESEGGSTASGQSRDPERDDQILAAIAAAQGEGRELSIRDLAELVGVPRSGVHRAVDRLRGAGLVAAGRVLVTPRGGDHLGLT